MEGKSINSYWDYDLDLIKVDNKNNNMDTTFKHGDIVYCYYKIDNHVSEYLAVVYTIEKTKFEIFEISPIAYVNLRRKGYHSFYSITSKATFVRPCTIDEINYFRSILEEDGSDTAKQILNLYFDRNNARSGKVNDFEGITQQMVSLYEKKNHDYGDSFGETFRKLGPISAITRITDKYNRLVSLATKGEQQVNDEKLEDTLIDLANYAVMTIMEIRNQGKNIISENIEKPE